MKRPCSRTESGAVVMWPLGGPIMCRKCRCPLWKVIEAPPNSKHKVGDLHCAVCTADEHVEDL